MTLSERLRDAEQDRSECFDSDGTPIESAFRDLGFNASYLFKEAADELDRLTARVSHLEKLVAAVASAPFPIHDYVTKEQWYEACHIYAALESKHE